MRIHQSQDFSPQVAVQCGEEEWGAGGGEGSSLLQVLFLKLWIRTILFLLSYRGQRQILPYPQKTAKCICDVNGALPNIAFLSHLQLLSVRIKKRRYSPTIHSSSSLTRRCWNSAAESRFYGTSRLIHIDATFTPVTRVWAESVADFSNAGCGRARGNHWPHPWAELGGGARRGGHYQSHQSIRLEYWKGQYFSFISTSWTGLYNLLYNVPNSCSGDCPGRKTEGRTSPAAANTSDSLKHSPLSATTAFGKWFLLNNTYSTRETPVFIEN